MTVATLNGHSRPIDYAFEYNAAGLSTVPIRADGTKAAACRWADFQRRLPTEQELATHYLADNVGIAIAYGVASGNAELVDVDNEEIFAPYCEELDRQSPGLLERLTCIRTPRPGYHLVYRCDGVEGNQKLALRPASAEELSLKPEEKFKTLIETRGRGGYALAPGSAPECHETGRLYEHHAGPPLTELPTITVEERETLLRVARLFNQAAEDEPEEASPNVASPQRSRSTGLSPGDDFNANASWEEILTPHGWTREFTHGDVTHWTRPGKGLGTSATTGIQSKQGSDLFCCFTTSAHPFPGAGDGKPCSTHTKFGAYTLLNHSGDFGAAAKQLAAEGYGEKAARQGMPNLLPDDIRNPPGDAEDFGPVPPPTPKKTEEPIAAPKPYPVDALPKALEEFVTNRAYAIDVCPSTVALPALATCAAAIGNSRAVKVTGSWSEPCALYVAIVARSGERKSPATEAATKPLSNIDFDLADEYDDTLAKYEEDRARWQAELKDWRKKADGPMPYEPKRPPEQRHVFSNITAEKLAGLLADNPRGILGNYDELSALFGNLDRYSGSGGGVSGDAPLYLSSYSAQAFRVDRKTTGSIRLRRPLLSLCGAIQPAVLNRALGEDHRENGLLARFLLTMPAERAHRWVDDAGGEDFTYHYLVRDLVELKPASLAEGKISPEYVELDREASGAFRNWYEHLQEERRLADDHEAAAIAKLEGATARMALIIRMVRQASEEPVDAFTIDGASMRSAIKLMEWQKGETMRAYKALSGDGETRRRSRLACWLLEKFGHEVTPRDLQRNGREEFRQRDAAEQALNELQAAGLGEWKVGDPGPKGGRPKRAFVLKPQVAP